LLSWFGAVAETPITTADFHKSRLGRTSPYYRRALAWARLLLQGSGLPAGGGQAPPLVLDTHKAFEKFAEAIARSALPDGCHAAFQEESEFLTGQRTQKHRPDILISDANGVMAVGDAKYKEVLEGVPDAQLETGQGVSARIQTADWNQLYVYMRMKKALCGFFIVPFWKAHGEQIEWLDQFNFLVPPCDPGVRVAVLAVNLLKPLAGVKQKAAERLRKWLF
jgi:5-methylcytosine-specific restriction endonuclease McrBC regulatory subunit McrC